MGTSCQQSMSQLFCSVQLLVVFRKTTDFQMFILQHKGKLQNKIFDVLFLELSRYSIKVSINNDGYLVISNSYTSYFYFLLCCARCNFKNDF